MFFHYPDGSPLILNHNYFLKKAVPNLTPEVLPTAGHFHKFLCRAIRHTFFRHSFTIVSMFPVQGNWSTATTLSIL